MSKKQRAGLNITLEAKLELDSLKSAGQSYCGIIQELVKFYKERSQDYWVRREREEKNR